MHLEFVPGTPYGEYKLFDSNNKILSVAKSAIEPNDIYEGKFRGTRDITYSPDNSAICIREDLSDASPFTSFIYLKRQTNGSYSVSYLRPPICYFDPKEPIGFEFPQIINISDTQFDLYYESSRKRKTVATDSITRLKGPAFTDEELN